MKEKEPRKEGGRKRRREDIVAVGDSGWEREGRRDKERQGGRGRRQGVRGDEARSEGRGGA